MQARRQNKTLAELATKAWNSEIGFSGYDPVEKTINGTKVSYDQRKSIALGQYGLESADHRKRRQYRNDKRRQVADFFLGNFTGMRNDTSEENVGRTILKNWIWLPEEGTRTGLKVVQYIGVALGFLTLITPAWMLYSLARNIVMNTAKVLLKFLPQLAVNGFTELQKRIKDEQDNGNRGAFAKFGLEVADWGLAVLKAPFQAINFVGGAVLSPIDNVRFAYKKLGILGAIGSVATSAILYAILLPLVAAAVAKYVPSFFSDTVVPFLTAKAPWLVKAGEAVGNFLAPVTNWIANTVYPAVTSALSWVYSTAIAPSTILNTMAGMFSYSMSSLVASAGLTVAPITMGLGAALAIVGTVIGTPLSRLYNFVVNKLIDLKPAPIAVPAAPVIGDALAPAPATTKAELARDNANLQGAVRQLGRTIQRLTDQIGVQDVRLEGEVERLDRRIVGAYGSVERLDRRVEDTHALADTANTKAGDADRQAKATLQLVRDQAAHKESVAALAGRVDRLAEAQKDTVAAIARFGALPAPASAPAAPGVDPAPAPKFTAGNHS